MNKLYNEVLISYDIEDNRSRTKLHNQLKDLSLNPIQKSVFWGYLNSAEEKAVQRLLSEHCATGDKGFIARIKLAEQLKRNSVGHSIQEFPLSPPKYHVI